MAWLALKVGRGFARLDQYNAERRRARDVERLDRIRHPEKYRGQ